MTAKGEAEADLVYRAPIVERLWQMMTAVAAEEEKDDQDDSRKAGLLVGLATAIDLIKGQPAATLCFAELPQVKPENPWETASEAVSAPTCHDGEPAGMTRPGDVIHDC